MADLYENLPVEQAQARANEQKRRIAEAMMAQGMEAATPYTSAGRYVVPMSWSQGLAKMAEALAGAYGMKKTQASQEAIAQALADKQAAAYQRYQQGTQATPVATPPALTPQGGPGGTEWNGQPSEQDQAVNSQNARANLMRFIGDPYANPQQVQAATLGETWKREDETSAANRELLRQNRLDDLAQRAEAARLRSEDVRLGIEQRREAAREHDETMRAIASIRADTSSTPKPPPGFRYKDDGTLEAIPGGPAAIKATASKQKEMDAKRVVDNALDIEIANIDKLIGPKKTTPDGKPEFKLHPGLKAAVGAVDVRTPTVFQDTADAESLIESLQSKASINALRDIRSGGSQSIGQITEREWPRLESFKGTLQMKQGDRQFPQSLYDYREELLRTKSDAERQLQQDFPDEGSPSQTSAPQAGGKTVVRTGKLNGRTVIQYSDGTMEYGD